MTKIRTGKFDAPGFARKPMGRPIRYDRDELRALHAQGLSDGRIATQLGGHRSYVGRLRGELGLAANHKSARTPKLPIERLRELHAQGMTDRQVADATGCSATLARELRLRLGMRANPGAAKIAQRAAKAAALIAAAEARQAARDAAAAAARVPRDELLERLRRFCPLLPGGPTMASTIVTDDPRDRHPVGPNPAVAVPTDSD